MTRRTRVEPNRRPSYFVGLDPAFDRDQFGLCVLWLAPQAQPDELPAIHVCDLQRVRNTDTQAAVREVTRLVEHLGGAAVAVDMRGVGRGVFDGLRRAGLRPTGINATSGHDVTGGGLVLNVPQSILFETTYQVFAAGRFRIAEDLPLAETLVRELQLVTARRTATGQSTYEFPRSEEGHGDLASALMIATLLADRQAQRAAMSYVVTERRRQRRRPGRGNAARRALEERMEQRRRDWFRSGGDLWTPMGVGADMLGRHDDDPWW